MHEDPRQFSGTDERLLTVSPSPVTVCVTFTEAVRGCLAVSTVSGDVGPVPNMTDREPSCQMPFFKFRLTPSKVQVEREPEPGSVSL